MIWCSLTKPQNHKNKDFEEKSLVPQASASSKISLSPSESKSSHVPPMQQLRNSFSPSRKGGGHCRNTVKIQKNSQNVKKRFMLV